MKNILEDDNAAFVILLKTFEYLSVLDLLNVSQVSKLWNFVCSHDLLWRKISLKNCYLKNYDGLFKRLLKHRTQELDIEGAILFIPHKLQPEEYWKKIFKRMKKITTLKKLKLGACPIDSLFMTATAAPQLKSFSSSHLLSDKMDLAPLTMMDNLEELYLKSAYSPIILTSIDSLQNIKNLRSLSLKRILNLNELVRFLPIGLRSLELGWLHNYNFDITDHENHWMNLDSLSKLVNLKRLCLSNETELGLCLHLFDTKFFKSLNKLEHLKIDRIYSEDLLKYLPLGLKSLTLDWNTFELNLIYLSELIFLNLLAIKDHRKALFLMNVCSIHSLKHLTSLTLKGVKNLKEVENYLPLSLEVLKMGDCSSLSSDFSTKIIPTLINLKRLELENGFGIFQTTDLLNVIAVMPRVSNLSLLNMELRRGFEKSLSRCINLEFLRISPHYSQNWDSLSIHQRIIYSVASLKKSLKVFILGFDCSFLDILNSINKLSVKVLSWNGFSEDEEMSIVFVNPNCSCAQPCKYPIHVTRVPIEAIEKEIFPELLPETRAWITKSGLAGINPVTKCICMAVGEHNNYDANNCSDYDEFDSDNEYC